VGQHLRHKAAAEVFKRQRRAVEQLQAADVRLNLLTGAGKANAARTRSSSSSCGISSPINADRILVLRVTKSCFSSSSISVS
jgi:hypothetical protein